MTQKVNRTQRVLVGATVVLAFCVVVVGAYTRLVDAGLGCPDWPGCYGMLTVPESESETSRAEQLYPEFPVDQAKAWTEMIHRYIATLLGIVVIGIVFVAWRGRMALTLPVTLLALVILQGAFGAWTVTLKLWPQVVTAHLLGGFCTLALLWLYFLKLCGANFPRIQPRLQFHLWILFAAVVLQVTLGGWTSSNYAALACPEFPYCHGTLFPTADYLAGFNIFQDIGPNYLGGELSNDARIAIQMAHRWGAYLVMFIGLALLFRLDPVPRTILGAILVTQFCLGVLNVVLSLPLVLAVLHNAVAAILLLVVVTLLFSARLSPTNNAGIEVTSKAQT